MITRIKTDNILDGEVKQNDIADGAVSFDKIDFVSGGTAGDVLTTDGLGNLAFMPPGGGFGTVDTVTGTVDLTSATAQNIGAAAGIPASATILSVLLDVTTISDAATTVTVGDATNGAASYMDATENDPQVLDVYIADGRLANAAAARQAQATVATAGTVGSATCIITFRHV